MDRPKRTVVTGELRKLQNNELHDLNWLRDIIGIVKLMKIRWAGHVVRVLEKVNAYEALVR